MMMLLLTMMIDSYGGKDFKKRKVSRREWKVPRERSTNGPGSEHDDGEELHFALFQSFSLSFYRASICEGGLGSRNSVCL